MSRRLSFDGSSLRKFRDQMRARAWAFCTLNVTSENTRYRSFRDELLFCRHWRAELRAGLAWTSRFAADSSNKDCCTNCYWYWGRENPGKAAPRADHASHPKTNSFAEAGTPPELALAPPA
jgi:hypothetical protein